MVKAADSLNSDSHVFRKPLKIFTIILLNFTPTKIENINEVEFLE